MIATSQVPQVYNIPLHIMMYSDWRQHRSISLAWQFQPPYVTVSGKTGFIAQYKSIETQSVVAGQWW